MSLIEEALRRAQDIPQSEQADVPRAAGQARPPTPRHPTVSTDISLREISQDEKPAGPTAEESRAVAKDGRITGHSASVTRPNWRMPAFLGLAFFILAGIIVWEVWSYVIPSGSQPVSATRDAHQPVATVERAAVTPRPVRRRLELTGVIEGAGEPLAIINGQIMRVGETVDGATLVAVSRNTARLRHRGQEIVLQTTR